MSRGELAGGKLVRHVVPRSEAHLIRRLTVESAVRHVLVVLCHVEGDELAECCDVVQRVQEEPLMLEGAPPSFDDRVREGDLDLCDDAAENRMVST